jgi:hypothetical protein
MCIYFFHDWTTATSEQNWFWCGANAINNAAYSEEVEVPEFVWRWFDTGLEIHEDSQFWMEGEPTQEFDEFHQTYVGCAAFNPGTWKMKTFNCRTPLPYICETYYES